MQNALLLLMQTRGLKIGAHIRRRIAECTDPDRLSRWLASAATATTAAQAVSD